MERDLTGETDEQYAIRRAAEEKEREANEKAKEERRQKRKAAMDAQRTMRRAGKDEINKAEDLHKMGKFEKPVAEKAFKTIRSQDGSLIPLDLSVEYVMEEKKKKIVEHRKIQQESNLLEGKEIDFTKVYVERPNKRVIDGGVVFTEKQENDLLDRMIESELNNEDCTIVDTGKVDEDMILLKLTAICGVGGAADLLIALTTVGFSAKMASLQVRVSAESEPYDILAPIQPYIVRKQDPKEYTPEDLTYTRIVRCGSKILLNYWMGRDVGPFGLKSTDKLLDSAGGTED